MKKQATEIIFEHLLSNPESWYSWSSIRDELLLKSNMWKNYTGMEIAWRLGYLARVGRVERTTDDGHNSLYRILR
jgi:hypothetical protein